MGFLSANLRFLREKMGMSQSDFGSLFDCTRDNIMSYERGTEPKLKVLQSVAIYFHTTIDILFNDELNSHCILERDEKESVYLKCIPNCIPNSKSKELGIQVLAEPVVQYVVRDSYDMTDVPLLDMAAAANSTSGFLASDHPDTLDHLLLPVSMLRKGGKNYAFRVVNDSMEPTLYVDDVIVVSHIEPSNYDQIREDRVCVIVSKSKGVIVKRIRNRLQASNLIRCRSDNKFYHSFNVYSEDLLNIFEVKCKISFNLPNIVANLHDRINTLEDRIEDLEIEVMKPKT